MVFFSVTGSVTGSVRNNHSKHPHIFYTGEAHVGHPRYFCNPITESFFNSRAHPSVLEVEAVNAPGSFPSFPAVCSINPALNPADKSLPPGGLQIATVRPYS